MEKIRVKGKMREVRYFGQVRVVNENGNVSKIVRDDGYLFVKNKPKTEYTKTI